MEKQFTKEKREYEPLMEGYDQIELLKNIVILTGDIELDPTYSKGNFYKSGEIKQPKYKSDLFPKDESIIQANANHLPFDNEKIRTIMFDPPFIAGHKQGKQTGIIAKRFMSFPNMKELWKWYDECFVEFYRILKPEGYLIFKCMDTLSGGKQWWSENHIVIEAEKLGFETKDICLLFAKHRMMPHNVKVQKHARKFHSYFIVFQKQKIKT